MNYHNKNNNNNNIQTTACQENYQEEKHFSSVFALEANIEKMKKYKTQSGIPSENGKPF